MIKSLLSIASMAAFALLVAGSITLSAPQEAEAKRFGMGSSFGSTTFKRQSPASSPSMSKQSTTPGKSTAATTPARSGLMGALGGLALGGLLGALFFGGAFEGINLFDILIFAAVAFLLISLFKRKTQSNYAYAGGQPQYAQQEETNAFMQQNYTSSAAGQAVHPQIDESFFINAARDIFVRMQKAWDNNDLEDIQKFCTAEVANRIAADMQQYGNHQTDVVALNASIEDSWVESSLEWVAVRFEALLSEKTLDASGNIVDESQGEMQETWIFQHDPASDDPTWFLAGIQQS